MADRVETIRLDQGGTLSVVPSPTRDTRRRSRWLIVTIVALIAFYLSGRFRPLVRFNTSSGETYSATVENASLIFGWNANIGVGATSPSPRPNGYWRMTRYRFSADFAWRPYHMATGPWPVKSNYRRLVIPLWPIPVLAIGWLIYLHGVARGEKLADSGRCRTCGYNLTGHAETDSAAACPECGAEA